MAELTLNQAFQIAVQHHQAGRLSQAEQLYRQILARQPNHFEALHLLGVIAAQVGRRDAAVELIRRAIELRPDFPEAYNNLGNSLKDTGLFDQAVAAYHTAVGQRPNYPDAYYNLGNALRAARRGEEAIAAFRQAIELKSDLFQAHNDLGKTLQSRGRLDEAIACYRQAIALSPGYSEAYNNLGSALHIRGQIDEAVAAYRQSVALNPAQAQAWNNLANALNETGQFDQAIAAAGRATALNPELADAYNNLGNALRGKGLVDDAIAAFRQAISRDPEFSKAHWNLGLALLLRGDFSDGWDEYEWRWKCVDFSSFRRNFPQPLWDGRPMTDATLLLHAEQGFGDAIQFIRYLPQVRKRVGKIIVECHADLQRLLKPLIGDCTFVAHGQPLPAFDFYCPLLTLARVCGTTLESIPADVPYLRADPELIASWRQKLNQHSAGLKVALAWAGNPAFTGDRTRSLSLDRLAALGKVSGVTFFSIQKGTVARQVDHPPPGLNLIDLGPGLKDFADTAAVTELMDLVITTDTSVAHLAGALGRPVWTMLQFAPDWRWLRERDDSPWYPTMRLFRQPAIGDWDGVVARIAEELNRLSSRARFA